MSGQTSSADVTSALAERCGSVMLNGTTPVNVTFAGIKSVACVVLLTRITIAGTPGELSVCGTNTDTFSIVSTSASDTGQVGYFVADPGQVEDFIGGEN